MTSPRDISRLPQRGSRHTAGFTLTEMLAATIVLTLLTVMVTAGVRAGTIAYQSSAFESESELLSHDIDSALSDPFRNMTWQTADDGSRTYSVIYRNDQAGSTVVNPRIVTVSGELYLQGDNTSGDGIKLLNGGAYANCQVTDVSPSQPITPAPGVAATDANAVASITVSYTIQSIINQSLTKQCAVTYVAHYSNQIIKPES